MNAGTSVNNKPFTLRSNNGDVSDYIKQLDKNLIQLWGFHNNTRTEFLKLKKRFDSSEIDHSKLQNLNSSNYSHLTDTQKTDLTDGGATTLHKHSWFSDEDDTCYVISNNSHTIDTSYKSYVYSGTVSGIVTLPNATGTGRRYTLGNCVTSMVKLKAAGSETINDDNSQDLYQHESVDVLDFIVGKWII